MPWVRGYRPRPTYRRTARKIRTAFRVLRNAPRTGRYATPRHAWTTRKYQRIGFKPKMNYLPVRAAIGLGQCAQEYLKVTLRPFDTNIMPCNLWAPPITSYRQRGFVRGIITPINFNATPEAGLIVTHGWCSDVWVAKLSTAAYVTTNAMSSFATNITCSNFQYASTQFTSAGNLYQWMPVLTAVRIRYMGPADSMQGVMYVAEHPSHGDFENFTVAELGTQFYARCVPISNQWTTIVSTGPKNQSELNFQSETGVAPASNTPYFLAITLSGVQLAGQYFQYEICFYSEVSGGANGNQWSEQDIIGGQRLSQAFEMAGKSLVPELQGRTIYNAVKATSGGFHNSSRVQNFEGGTKLTTTKGTVQEITPTRSYSRTPSASSQPRRNYPQQLYQNAQSARQIWNTYGRPIYNAANTIASLLNDANTVQEQLTIGPPPI